MWYRCDIELPDDAVAKLFPARAHNGRDFRKLIALLADEMELPLPSQVMNYEDGRPRQGLPPVRFAGYARGVSLLGLGNEGVGLARQAAPLIHSALIRRSGRLLRAFERSGKVQLEPTRLPLSYVTRAVVLSPSKPAALKRWLGWVDQARARGVTLGDIPEAREEMARRLEEALLRQVDALDPPVAKEPDWFLDPEDDETQEGGLVRPWGLLKRDGEGSNELEMQRRGKRPFAVKIKSCGKHFLETRMNERTRERLAQQGQTPPTKLPLVGVHHLEFTVNADLEGLWQVGRLTSSGYGVVHKCTGRAVYELKEVA